MNRLYEKKCDCQSYDEEHRSSLIKMELPEYEETPYRTLGHSVVSTIRLVFYLLVLVLLGYSLWRIHEIEVAINASDRYVNITRLIESANLNSNSNHHSRQARSVKANNMFELNGLGVDGKGEREEPVQSNKKPMNKDEFVRQMNALFDKIQSMHNDTDRSHFDNNMKAVFRAWIPVFDALLPRDVMVNPAEAGRAKRSAVKSSEESSEEKKKPTRVTRSAEDSSMESVAMKISEWANKTSEKSSEEKKPARVTRSVKASSEESGKKTDKPKEKSSEESDEKKGKPDQKSNEESSEEKKRVTRSTELNSEESIEVKDHSKQENSEEQNSAEIVENKNVNFAVSKVDDISRERNGEDEEEEEEEEEEHERRNRSADSDSSESSQSSDSLESIEKKLRKKLKKPKDSNENKKFIYYVATDRVL